MIYLFVYCGFSYLLAFIMIAKDFRKYPTSEKWLAFMAFIVSPIAVPIIGRLQLIAFYIKMRQKQRATKINSSFYD